MRGSRPIQRTRCGVVAVERRERLEERGLLSDRLAAICQGHVRIKGQAAAEWKGGERRDETDVLATGAGCEIQGCEETR